MVVTDPLYFCTPYFWLIKTNKKTMTMVTVYSKSIMLTDIFSSFDANMSPQLVINTPVWLTAFFLTFLFHFSLWLNKSRLFFLINYIKVIIYEQASRTVGKNIRGFSIFLVSLFISLIIVNLSGLIPYTFSARSHLVITFSLAVPMWFSLIISGWVLNPAYAAAHLLPTGAPNSLGPALILIETIRIFLRPITLSVRLAANISAGHLILGLIRSYLSAGLFTYSSLTKLIVIFIEAGYFLFEVGICLIQAYVFCLLLSLYSDEHPSLPNFTCSIKNYFTFST